MKKTKLTRDELIDLAPKNLRHAISCKIDGATAAIHSVFFAIVDRFNNDKNNPLPKECYDSNVIIQDRTHLSKVTVENLIKWILKHRFLKAEYRVTIFTSDGSAIKTFSSNQEAIKYINSYRKNGGRCKYRPQRVFMPPDKFPTCDELGLFLMDKNNGIYTTGDPINNKHHEDKNYPHEGRKLNSPVIKSKHVIPKNYGAKLDISNETLGNQMEDNENSIKEMEIMIINNNTNDSVPKVCTLTAEEALLPFKIESLTADEHLYDSNLAVSLIALKTLESTQLLAEANYKISRSCLKNAVKKIAIGHFLYPAIIFKKLNEEHPWFEILIENFGGEIEGLSLSAIEKYADELIATDDLVN